MKRTLVLGLVATTTATLAAALRSGSAASVSARSASARWPALRATQAVALACLTR